MGRIVLFLLMSINLYAQADKMTIRGVAYEFVGDSFSDFRTPHYRDIDPTNPSSYLNSFVRYAIHFGANLDLTNDNYGLSLDFSTTTTPGATISVRRNQITFVSSATYAPYSMTLPDGRVASPAASSWGSLHGGYSITVNRDVWNVIDDEDKASLMFHEFGHALLHADHVCERQIFDEGRWVVNAVMSTGTCATWNSPRTIYDFSTEQGYLSHFFNEIT